MTINELNELADSNMKICIFGAGELGKGDAYLFLKNMLCPKRIDYFCDSNMRSGIEICDGIKTIDIENLCLHKKDIICVIAVSNKKIQEEIKTSLIDHKIDKIYTINYPDIFRICDEMSNVCEDNINLRVQRFFRERKYEFQIETTSFCNAKCEFCPNSMLKREKTIMSSEIFEKIIDRIKDENISVSNFILHLNGEPLIDRGLFNRIRRLKEEFPGACVRFTTNFALADEAVINNIFDSHLDKITCSLNSINADEYRKIMNLSYETTINNINRLLLAKRERNSKLEVCLSIVETSDNSDEVRKFTEIYSGQADVRVLKLGQWVDKENEDIKIQNRDNRDGICSILYRTVNILSNGDYALCCFDAEGIVNKNIMDTDIHTAWRSGVFDVIRKWHLKNGKTNKECIKCSY